MIVPDNDKKLKKLAFELNILSVDEAKNKELNPQTREKLKTSVQNKLNKLENETNREYCCTLVADYIEHGELDDEDTAILKKTLELLAKNMKKNYDFLSDLIFDSDENLKVVSLIIEIISKYIDMEKLKEIIEQIENKEDRDQLYLKFIKNKNQNNKMDIYKTILNETLTKLNVDKEKHYVL